MTLGLLIIQAVYFFLPAYAAIIAPMLFHRIPVGEKAVYEQWFGKNKTWRGVVIAIFAAVVVFWIQRGLYESGFVRFAVLDYSGFPLEYGFLLGVGAVVGDLWKSYLKRKEKIKEGEPWVPMDQLCYVFGALLFSFWYYVPYANLVLVLVIVSFVLHIGISYCGYLIGIREAKW